MTAFTAVLLYAVWTLLLPIGYASIRVPLIAGQKKRADHWERGKAIDDPPLLVRARNAHSNCAENFPVFAAVVVVAALLGKIAIADAVAGYVFYARIAQSLAHLAGTTLPLVALRGFFYFIQVVLILYIVGQLLRG
jgi:uncharacterized MAPEG superfamily protein